MRALFTAWLAAIFSLGACSAPAKKTPAKRPATKNQPGPRAGDARAKPPAPAAKRAPDFTLPDHRGGSVTLSKLLAQGPVVLVFYRGFW